MNIWGFLTKALIRKPKKLSNGWEHKKGFFVSISADTALNVISNARNSAKISSREKVDYSDLPKPVLRDLAEKLLYKIESSHSNYFEILCAIGGLFLIGSLLNLLPVLWNNPHEEATRYFLVYLITLLVLIFLYKKKMKIDKRNVEHFLDIENALYKKTYIDGQ